MFQTTAWTMIREAGAGDRAALEAFAERYRPAVLVFLRGRRLDEAEAEDLCQETFVRLLRGDVLARADRARGRFRSLLLSIVTHVVQDRRRKRREAPLRDVEPAARDEEFDRAWVLNLAERAMERLREKGSPYYDVLRGHLRGEPQDRNRVWIARRQLVALIREEIAFSCRSQAEFEEEVAYLGAYLRPQKSVRRAPVSRE